ncbi:MAG: DUF3786 domain-containing protein [Desulfitobacterium hafniense]|nr:DUF3786 domain-containing protein [Desulfitobacterium hafniense]
MFPYMVGKADINPLAKTLSHGPAGQIQQACLKFAARLEETADVCAIFDFLPRFPVTVKLWLKDEEVEGSANILFDASAMIVYCVPFLLWARPEQLWRKPYTFWQSIRALGLLLKL